MWEKHRSIVARVAVATLLPLAVLAACDREPTTGPPNATGFPEFSVRKKGLGADVGGVLVTMNQRLEALDFNVRVISAEWLTDAGSGHHAQAVVADDRNVELGHHWVAGDVRRAAAANSITYLVDAGDGAANPDLTGGQTEAAIDRAVATWSGVPCVSLGIVKLPDTGADPDIVDGLLGFGDVGDPFLADITHAGWMPAAFFDALLVGGSEYVLSVTFSFIFLDPATDHDINGDGKLDTAFREIYYNNNLTWGIDADANPFDVETVALHETGHGLSQGHFGRVVRTDADGMLHLDPLAVMNAALARQLHSLQGTDRAGHCSIWHGWPND